jgi:P27 family predicted phage terminase small subunit
MPRLRKPPEVSQRHMKPKTLDLRANDELIVPDPPKGLLKRSSETWTRFFSSEVARALDLDSDLGRLERWIRFVDQWHRTYDRISNEPTVAGSKGQVRPNPLIGYLRTLEESIARTEREFGLTPRARFELGLTFGQAALTAHELNRLTETEAKRTEFDPEFADA